MRLLNSSTNSVEHELKFNKHRPWYFLFVLENKILDWSKFKAFVDDKINVDKKNGNLV